MMVASKGSVASASTGRSAAGRERTLMPLPETIWRKTLDACTSLRWNWYPRKIAMEFRQSVRTGKAECPRFA